MIASISNSKIISNISTTSYRVQRKNKPTVIDLFSGCGGVSLGFAKAGFDVRAAVEINKIAAQTYKNNEELIGKVKLLEKDINSLSADEILKAARLKKGQCTVVTGCAPCQGFSRHRMSGEISKKDLTENNNLTRAERALSDPRNQLFKRLIELIVAIEPEYYLIENVPDLKLGLGKDFYCWAEEQLKAAGYTFIGEVVNCYQYGIPQARRRLVILGCKKELCLDAFELPPITHEEPKKIKEAQEKVDRSKINKHIRLSEKTIATAKLKSWETVRSAIENYPELKSGQSNPKVQAHMTSNLAKINLERLQHTQKNGGSRSDWPEKLKLKCHENHSGHGDVYGRMSWDKPAPTITGGCFNITKGRFAHPEQDRGISMREAAALQTFPDDFVFAGTLTQIALQVGNAVPVKLAQIMAEHIYMHRNKRLAEMEKSITV